MKLRIKETGEVLEDVKYIDTTLSIITIQYLDNGILRETRIKNLSDIEEVKEVEDELFYVISAEHKDGYMCVLKEDYKEICDIAKKLGLGFEIEKEAEKAVEKLKAWKELKDDGITYSLDEDNGVPYIVIHSKEETGTAEKVTRIFKNLTLLFGGE